MTQTGKHSAAGQYLGYALQPVRLCFHLLNAPDGASVSLEHLDDVAVHLAGGEVILEQSKSALKQNPLSDWATDLWKSLANWLSFMAAGEIDPTTSRFRLYVTPVKAGGFATALNDAKTDDEVEALLANLVKAHGKLKAPPACDVDVQTFLTADAAYRTALVKNLTIISVDADPVEPIRAIFKPTVSPLILDLVCERAIGAAKEAADRLIRAGKPAILNADSFRAEQRAFVQKNNLPGLLASFTDQPPFEAVEQLIADRPAFVRQLEFIEVGDEACVRAVSDYLRTLADISIWGESGLIFEKNLSDWDDDLVSRYEHVSAEVQDVQAGHPATVRGRIVYRRCAQLQPPLDGRVVPGHFVHGSFNALAHGLRLGWHPDYKTLLGPAT
ncbi:ABC-three component system protein [Aureimonas pseudogalii]